MQRGTNNILPTLCIHRFDVIEAHCYVVDIGRTDCEQIQFRTQLTNAYVAKTSCISCYIDSAMYLLTISSPNVHRYLNQ